MIDLIVFQWQLGRLRRSRRRTAKLYGKQIAEAKKKNEENEVEFLADEQWKVSALIDDDIRRVVTRRLFNLADKYMLPRPEFGDMEGGAWEEGFRPGRYLLKPEAISELRGIIRKEQKERHEHMLLWVGALTGLVGAISGLIAVIGAI